MTTVEPASTLYITRPGDMLDMLALRFFDQHDSALELLLAANARYYTLLTEPVLRPGLVLVIPDRAALPSKSTAPMQQMWD